MPDPTADLRNIPLLKELVNLTADMSDFVRTVSRDCRLASIDPHKEEYADTTQMLLDSWNVFWRRLNETSSNSDDGTGSIRMPVVDVGMPQSEPEDDYYEFDPGDESDPDNDSEH